MGNFSFSSSSDEVRRLVAETIEKTVIHRRQREMAPGLWDFAVFGPGKEGTAGVARICRAEQARIQTSPLYLTAVGDPSRTGVGGIPIEELTGERTPPELEGLEVYHASPLRPIEVTGRREADSLERLKDELFEELEGKNMAIIETPEESVWVVSALRYLDECDFYFPDPFTLRVRESLRPGGPGRFLQ